MAFTPFVFEDLRSFIDASADDLYLFSSDYPHVEGGKDPMACFEQSLGEREAPGSRSLLRREFLENLSQRPSPLSVRRACEQRSGGLSLRIHPVRGRYMSRLDTV